MAVVEEGRFGKAPLRFDVSPRTSALGGRKPVEQRCSVAPRPLSALAQSFRSSSLLGDGQWVWRVDLAHHVAKYRLGLGQELLSYGWRSELATGLIVGGLGGDAAVAAWAEDLRI